MQVVASKYKLLKEKRMQIGISISPGELIDRITVLELKVLHCLDILAKDSYSRELSECQEQLDFLINFISEDKRVIIFEAVKSLRQLNKNIWEIVTNIHKNSEKNTLNKTEMKVVSNLAIERAKLSDLRSNVKQQVNNALSSTKISYMEYGDSE